MAENWYIVLGLDFDPPVEDEAVIAAKIEERSRFWSTHFNDFKMGANYRYWHRSIPQIKKDMIGPANIRKQLAADACKEVYGPIDKLLNIIAQKGGISEKEIDKIAEKMKATVEMVRKRANALGIKIVHISKRDYQAVYEQYYKNKPENATMFEAMQSLLKTFKVTNLYEFLFIDTELKNISWLPYDVLRQRATELKKCVYYKTDSISGVGARLCTECEKTFNDSASKAIYDTYLEYVQRKNILDEVRIVGEICGELTEEIVEMFVTQLTEILHDRKLAETVFAAFCTIENLLYKMRVAPASGGSLTATSAE